VGFQSPTTTSAGTHSDLLGLGADDHLQYLRTDGTRTASGDLSFGTHNITTVGTLSTNNLVQGSAELATNATDGFAWVSSCPGVPTGNPVAPYLNAAALVVDTANSNLLYRVGSSWIAGTKLTGGSALLGWADITGNILTGGAIAPVRTNFRGNIDLYAFSATAQNEAWFTYHVPHDYAPGTDIYFHVHWSTAGTNTGVVRWVFEYTIAKGHGQSVYPVPSTATVDQAYAAPAYRHMLAETTAISSPELEPDSVILVRLTREGGNPVDTQTGVAYLITADVHYQSDRHATKNRTPNFYI
jgi:hypothetical protein